MSLHICSNCGHEERIFGEGGGERMCKDYSVEFLGALPLDGSIRADTDSGKPSVVSAPDSRVTDIYKQIARRVAVKIGETAVDHSAKFPNIVISNT
jgi:ATP-binding protein involved in chromosome partitioning